MKLHFFALFCLLQLSLAIASHHHLNVQQPGVASTSLAPPPPPPPQAPPPPPQAPPPPPPSSVVSSIHSSPAPLVPTTSTVASSPVTSPVPVPTYTGPPPLQTYSGVPPLLNITSGMPTRTTEAPSASYTPGATPPLPKAPVLPAALQQGNWPIQDRVPDTTSPEVQQWLKELDGVQIPNLPPTVDGTCVNDPAAAANAATNGWWTCGGHTRVTDIVNCPDKYTWGVSFDDGPSPYTQYLLDYLKYQDINATFFVVGSRVLDRPNILIEEYMSGHEISVHTWSHPSLTTLTNEQIVAELGWTRKIIKDTIGVTPTTMRAPYGDVDDRVRAISLAMGMNVILWSGLSTGVKFDTNDWKVASGVVKGIDSFDTFEAILGNASLMDTGFIVLQHDLFEITVDLAVGYTLNAALTHTPAFRLQPIGECQKFPPGDLYLETNTNATFPYLNKTASGVNGLTSNGLNSTSPSSTGTNSNKQSSAGLVRVFPFFSSLTIFGLAVVIGALF